MPSIFKALASISVWILFVFGCINLLGGMFGYYKEGFGGPVPMGIQTVWALGVACFILGVVAMKLRHMLE